MRRRVKNDSFYLAGDAARQEPYRYRACGLDGIYLLNGYEITRHDSEEHVSIRDVDGLHKAIGRHLVTHRKGLAPTEVRFLRNTMGLTQSQLANMLGNNSQSVARWEKGECEIPGSAEKLLRAIFLASLMTQDELSALRDLLLTKLEELDKLDEVVPVSAQFELFDRWSETPERVAA